MMMYGVANTNDHSVAKTKCCNFSLCTKTQLGMVNTSSSLYKILSELLFTWQ